MTERKGGSAPFASLRFKYFSSRLPHPNGERTETYLGQFLAFIDFIIPSPARIQAIVDLEKEWINE
jgi:hypothetical protein